MALFKSKKRALGEATAQARRNLVSVHLDRGQADRSRCDVIGSIFFSPEILKTEIGSLTLELTGGHFYFRPQSSHIPADSLSSTLTPPLNLSANIGVNVVRGHSQELQHTATREYSGALKAEAEALGKRKASAEMAGKVGREDQRKHADSGSETLSYAVGHRSLSASPYDRTGVKVSVEAPPGMGGRPQALRGRLYDDRMFSLERTGGDAASVKVGFQPSPSHVDFRDGTGAWGKDLIPEKRQLIRRLLAKLVEGEEWDLGEFELMPEDAEAP